MAVELATAYVSIVPSMRGVKSQLAEAMNLDSVGRIAGTSYGRGLHSQLAGIASTAVGILKNTLLGAGIGGAIFGGTMLKSGLDRLVTIQDATASLKVIMGDAAKAGVLMQHVKETVQGTPFNLDQFAQAAKNLVAMNVPAEKVPGYLRAIGETAAASGKGAEGVSVITDAFGKMAAQGKVSLDQIWSISDAGVPALQILANGFHVNTGEMQKMISKGMVPAGKALDILTEGIMNGSNGAAGATQAYKGTMEELRQTYSGALGGFQAAIARFGAGVITPFLPWMTQSLTQGATLLDALGKSAVPAVQSVVDSVQGFFKKLDFAPIQHGIDVLFSPKTATNVGLIRDAFVRLLPSAGGVTRTLSGTAGDALVGFAKALEFLAQHTWILTAAFYGLLGALALHETRLLVISGLEARRNALSTIAAAKKQFETAKTNALTAALWVHAAALKVVSAAESGVIRGMYAWDAATAITAGAMRMLSATVMGIPFFGWIVAAITLVVGALTWFFTSTDLGRQIWANVMAAIGAAANWLFTTILKPAFEWVVSFWNTILLPALQFIGNVFVAIFQGIAAVATWLWTNILQPVFAGLVAFWQGVVAPILAWVGSIFTAIFTVIGTVATWLWRTILQPYFTALVVFWQTVLWPILSWLGAAFKAIFSLIGAIVVWAWEDFISPAMSAMVAFWKNVFAVALQVLADGFKTAWDIIVGVVTWAINTFINPAINAMVWAWQNVIAPALTWLYQSVFLPVWNAISAAVVWVVQTVIGGAIAAMVLVWQVFVAPALQWLYQNVFLPIWNAIGNAVRWVINTFITPAINAMVWAWQNVIAPALQWLYSSVIQPIWTGIGNSIKWVWDNVIKPVFDFFGNIISNVLPRAFQTGVDLIGKFWDGLKRLASLPVEFVVNTIINDGIVKNFNKVADFFHSKDKIPELHFAGFASGGILPGYTPGRDVHRFISPTGGVLDLSGGEAIMRPEVTRVLGVGGVNALNSAARSGGISAVQKVLGHRQFRSGGVLAFSNGGTTKKDDFDPLSLVGEFFTDPVGLAKKFYSGLLGSIPGAGSTVGNIVGAIPGRVADAAIDWVKSLTGGGDASPGGGTGMGYKAQEAWMRSVLPWAQVTSDTRPPGTKTAGGGLSYHSLGRAVDFIGHGAEGMKQIFTTIRAAYPNSTQLIHTPMGALQLLNGKSHVYGEPDAHMHYNHVHWAMKQGGILDRIGLFDNGGYLNPGHFAYNASNRPEPVFSSSQWDALANGMQPAGREEHTHIDISDAALRREADRLAEEIEKRKKRAAALSAWR